MASCKKNYVINKCLSGKSTGYDGLRLSQAQILWGMYHKKNVDYAYLLWEDFVYQVENKNVKRSNEMYYPRFTKVIPNFFMTKDSSIPRRNNRVNWHFAKDDPMFTTIKTKTPPTTKGKRLKTSVKAAKPAKKKQTIKTSKAKGLIVLSERSGADEGTGGKPGVPNVPTYGSDDEQISWKSGEEEDDDEVGKNDDDDDDDADNQDDDGQEDDGQEYDGQDDDNQVDDNKQTDSDNDGDDFVHPMFSIHNEEDIQEEGSDMRVHTPSHYEFTDDEDSDKE
ncbi:hypothetical protein Tco_1079694, partial [Tanacetum coccineum]